VPIDILAVVRASVALRRMVFRSVLCSSQGSRFCCCVAAQGALAPTDDTRTLTSFVFALRWLIDYCYYCSVSGFCTFVITRGAAALSRLLNLRGSQELRVSCVTDLLTKRGRFETPNFQLWFTGSFVR
jgi:hypothetical protein